MTTLRIGQAVEFKSKVGLGGWQPGTVSGFVGRLIEVRGKVRGKTYTHAVPPSRVRPSRGEAKPDRGAQQAQARAQRLVMAPPPMETEEAEEVIPPTVKPMTHAEMLAARVMMQAPVFNPQPKAAKPTRKQAYLKWVRMQPCALTGLPAEDAHHYENAGMGRKCSDFMTVPLTHLQHMQWHDGRYSAAALAAAEKRGETYETLATKLAMAEAGWRALVNYLETQKEGGKDE